MEIVYGPVSSWRLGRSLGIDLICRGDEKICSFDCVYCSLGKTTEKTIERREFVSIDIIKESLVEAMEEVEPDVVTISGTGEPTLAENLGEAIKVARNISNLPIAVLTNSSLMYRKDVRQDLDSADIVVGSLDAPNEEIFKEVNKPHEEIHSNETVEGMKKFSKEFEGVFSLEVMFVPGNKDSPDEIAEVARSIDPDEIQINTPLRDSPVEPLTPEEMKEIEKSFEGMNSLSVYKAKKEKVEKIVGPKKLKRLKRPKEN